MLVELDEQKQLILRVQALEKKVNTMIGERLQVSIRENYRDLVIYSPDTHESYVVPLRKIDQKSLLSKFPGMRKLV